MIDWRAILAEHGLKVWRTAYRILSDHADAMDCYQEVFLTLHQTPPRLQVQDWGAYLTTLASRRAINRLRARSRTRALITTLDKATIPHARGGDPADQVIAAELMDRLRLALAELPERQAQVIWLASVEGLTNDQIASQLQTTPGAVRVLLHRARAALTELLNLTVSQVDKP
jgi:RNA polymerase sigma-70 factor (ECF subfamily)